MPRRYTVKRKTNLRARAMLGVAGRERKRMERAADMVDVGGLTTDGCLGAHSIRLLAGPDGGNHLAIVADGRHRQARTLRGIIRCIAIMIYKASRHGQ